MPTALKGPVLFTAASFLFAVMAVFVKLASPYAPASEIAFVRFVVGIIAAILLAAAGKISLRAGRPGLMAARGVFGGLAILLYFAAIKSGAVTNATVLHNTYPLFATVFAAFYLKERIRPSIILPLLISVVGVILLTKPSFTVVRLSEFYALASGLTAGVSVVIIKALRKTESAWSVFFYLSIFGAVFSGAMALPQLVLPESAGVIYMLLAAGFGTIGQVVNTSAYKYCTTSAGATISMSTTVFSALFGLAFLGERLSYLEAIGAVVILASSAYIAYYGSSEPKEGRGEKLSC